MPMRRTCTKRGSCAKVRWEWPKTPWFTAALATARCVQSRVGSMSTNERATDSMTQASDRPTRAAVVLTLAMGVVPLLPLLVSAAGCHRPSRPSAVEVRSQDESARPNLQMPATTTSTDRSLR